MSAGAAERPTAAGVGPRASLSGVALGLVAAAAFGTSGIAARPLLDAGWSPTAAVLVRIGVAALLLAGPAVWILRRDGVAGLRGKVRLLVLFGVFGVAGAQVCYFNAVQHLSVGVALLIEYSGILLVVAWNWLRGLVPARITLAGAAIAVVGLALVLDAFGGAEVSATGVLWAFGAAVGLAVYFVIGARTEDGVHPIVMVSSGMVVGAVALGLLGAVGLMPVVIGAAEVTLLGNEIPAVVVLLWLCLVTAVLAYVAGVVASRRLGSTTASFLGLTEVLFAVVFAWLLLAEVPSPVQLLGGVAVLIGVVLVRLGELRRSRPPTDLAGVAVGDP
ncbi:protein of unknown function DUF6 transmembrane [Beutenbergia cavernae DSM 12333]|uniref:EamA domain-containing protein n=1 Tax=Beutenbergia cavernae (strain ATCC BAA-8 / DSM 12333 / CCUG 43141 / JCM 11478 / NBRC 16432 / NCIMB 13614 / HKI 0122) TaxID=471853 RepID=C5C3M1_BEUC1|nr:DMT family transporter [Beutenbergia cavernae]ACQ81930.1 protein of unknown function DUF6 transmembrane [Beutenbergia cavernae DSM 12333]